MFTLYECDRCEEYISPARDYWGYRTWEPMRVESFQDYMTDVHPSVWWQWCVDDDLLWLKRVKYGRYDSEKDREEDMRCATVALEHAQRQLEKVKQ